MITIEQLVERLKSCPNQKAEVVIQQVEGFDANVDKDIVTTVWMNDNKKFIIITS